MTTTTFGFNDFLKKNSTRSHQIAIVVRAEEVLIVMLVLALWVAAIALFFNRWGKIRMLEPYQPKFIQQQKPSCSMVDQTILQRQQRAYSKFNVLGETFGAHSKIIRPRQNSVFAGPSAVTLSSNSPRKVKSAFDLKDLVESHSVLRESANIKINFDDCSFRRQSMLTVLSKKPPADGGRRDNAIIEKEHRQNVKDLVDAERNLRCENVHYRQNNDFFPRQLKSKDTKLRLGAFNHGPYAESRRNSIAYLDSKPLGSSNVRFVSPKRRFSLLQGQKMGFFSARTDAEEIFRRPEITAKVSDFRGNSALPSSSAENDKNLFIARDKIKSGVVDFRRNSMLIINNLTEDIDCRLLSKNLSLASSNIALASDSHMVRKDFINLTFGHESKYKSSNFRMKPFLNHKLNVFHVSEGNCTTGNPFRSLDFEDVSKVSDRRNGGRRSFAGEARNPFFRFDFAGSTASLNTCCSRFDFKVVEESRSAENVDSVAKSKDSARRDSNGFYNKIICKESLNYSKKDLKEILKCLPKPTANVTTSLNNLAQTCDEK